MAEQFFRNLYQGAYQPRQAVAGVQPPVPPPTVLEQQQVEPEVEQPERQQRSGTGSTRAGRQRTAVTEDMTALLERFLRLRPPMFHGGWDVRPGFLGPFWPRPQGRARRPGRNVVAPERSAATALGHGAPGRRVLVVTGVVSDACSIDAACLGIATAFPVSEASVLRWCRPACAGDMFEPFGARRRHSFLREGPNGFVLRVEVGTLHPLALSMLPSPLYIVFPLWFGAWECENSMLEVERVPELPPTENATPLEAAILSRWPGRPRQDRGALGCRDLVATARAVATARCVATSAVVTIAWDPHPREPVEGVLRATRVLELAATRQTLEHGENGGETSQQRQGARRAEETGR
ncbi:hypothetical protein Taro_036139 [Colocasia esculenta]|uniref:Uncharacterized protein n=1 Tax=Colocasia esculenta TaxID=4460 RepID=A0A843W8T7_COLES|nr:hypothetical protein [Colocasia esculenta]